MTTLERYPLLEMLHRRSDLSEQVLEDLAMEEFESQADLEQRLIEDKLATNEDILLALAEHARMPAMSIANYTLRDDLLHMFPRGTLSRNKFVPIARTEVTLTLGIADPLNLMAVEEAGILTQLKVMPVAVLESEINDLLLRSDRSSEEALDDILKRANESSGIEVASGDVTTDEDNVDIDKMLEGAEDAPVIKIVNMILVEAMHRKASDIHLEPFEKEMRLRYRVDGMLQEGPGPPKALQSAIISRIKVMANLDIAERRVPQDGRFRIRAQGREIDMRISSLPTVHGEKIVLRLLDKGNLLPNLEALGLDELSHKRLETAITAANGLVLVTGPTGSGKTTTLYSCLSELNNPDVNIVTVENPVEYQLHGINQVEIHTEIGMSFSAALRSILRQDPDIVLVGETRDKETANIAVEAALTGHLVMTTLHTNDAPGAISRLAYMGVEPFMIASALKLSQAQRLVRRICKNCKEPYQLTEEEIVTNELPTDVFDGKEVFRGRGCSRCNGTGYKGRAGIMEVMTISPDMRELILRTTNSDDIRKLALKEGLRDLRMSGWSRVIEGATTIEEVMRVTVAD